jgi:hypothetical protein
MPKNMTPVKMRLIIKAEIDRINKARLASDSKAFPKKLARSKNVIKVP